MTRAVCSRGQLCLSALWGFVAGGSWIPVLFLRGFLSALLNPISGAVHRAPGVDMSSSVGVWSLEAAAHSSLLVSLSQSFCPVHAR